MLDRMFENIGKKLKTLAKIGCALGIVGAILSVLSCFVSGNFSGLLIAVLMVLIPWVGGFGLYGFGELIEQNDKIIQNTRYLRIKNKHAANNAGADLDEQVDPTQELDLLYQQLESGEISQQEYDRRRAEILKL